MIRRITTKHAVGGAALVLAACSAVAGTAEGEVSDTATAAVRSADYADMGRPYFGGALPGGMSLVPPAPEPGSAVQARDDDASRAGLALTGSGEWALAGEDASLRRGALGRAFSCAAGIEIDHESTPALAGLMSRAATDLGLSTSEVKAAHSRSRPFMVNGEPTCTPEAETVLRMDGSYPSGHSAMGYGLGLILAEILPDRAAMLVSRGREFGESRRICNVHWKSDIEEGRQFAAAVVARLHADPSFLSDIAAAKAEVATADTAPDAARCERESTALALGR